MISIAITVGYAYNSYNVKGAGIVIKYTSAL